METIQDKYVNIDGLRIHYLEAGTGGPTLLLLHGAALDSARMSFGHSIGKIAERCRVIAPDLPGYGDSDKPDADYSTEYHISFLERFIEVMDIRKACLAGLSMGGAVVLGYTLRRPENVGSLALISSYGMTGIVRNKLTFILVLMPFFDNIIAALLCKSRWFTKWGLRRMIYSKRHLTKDLITEARKLACISRAGLAFRTYDQSEFTFHGPKTNYSAELSKISVPTLILHGVQDWIIPLPTAQKAARQIRTSTVWVVPNCGHWISLEKPHQFAEAVLDFILTQPKQQIDMHS